MRSEQETQRRLVTADEVMRLPEDALLVFAGAQPIQGVKTPYFLDREFQQRASLEPPAIARVTRSIEPAPAPAIPERSVPTDDELLAQLLPLDDDLEHTAESEGPSARSATPQLSELL
jgi:type IV secretory pathway TraG/TraD family ATPase VirD4